MRILVTGGAGFIGSHVIDALKSIGHQTALLDDFNDFYSPELKRTTASETGAGVFEGDLRLKEDVEKCFDEFKPDAVIHLAARAGVRPSLTQTQLYVDTNVTGTLNILDAMRSRDIKRLVFASSSSVYGCNEKVPFSESDPIQRTISPYAATKVAGEHLCSVYAHLYDMSIVALRFFTVYGPRQRPDLAIHKFARLIDEGRDIPQFGDGSTRRDYTYIDDIIQGILKSFEYTKDHPGLEILNLGESRTVELRELIALLEKALGKKAILQKLPMQPGDVPVTYADITKAREVIEYNPTTAIEEGIEKFIDWYKNKT
ncbi:MAG: NAD-dependent epimerase/dehydratase family protein [Verrucomicrobiota bacterium]